MIRKLCDTRDLPAEGQLRAFMDHTAEPPIALCVGVLEGIVYAIDNTCPHQRASLAAGQLEHGYVVCPVHGWKFRITDGAPFRQGDPAVPSCEVRRIGEEVFVRLPSGPNRLTGE